MKRIQLTQGKYALVDNNDYLYISKFTWLFHKKPRDKYGYAVHGTGVKMHRLLLFAKPRQYVDHINGDGLDNRRANLRLVNPYQSIWNRKQSSTKKSKGCKGVSIVRDRNGVPAYWIARITKNKKRYYLGVFKNYTEASRAYITASKKLHGEYSPWNT